MVLLVGDIVAIALALALAAKLGAFWSRGFDWRPVALAAMPIYIAAATNLRAYAIDALQYPGKGLSRAVIAAVFTLLVILLVGYSLGGIGRSGLAIALILVPAALALARLAGGAIGGHVFENRYLTELVIVDGEEVDAPAHAVVIDARDVGIEPNLRDPVMLLRLAEVLEGADRVIIACRPEAQYDWAMSLKGANVRAEILKRDLEMMGPIGVGRMSGGSTMVIASGPLGRPDQIVKRGFDLGLAVLALAVLAPVLAAIACAIKLDSKGPVLFRQSRVGWGNSLFTVFKFRTMRTEMCDADGTVSTRADDDRVTRVGHFLRRTSLDELPQLFNVLLGSMSLVGPRPHALGSLAGQEHFWEVDERYWHRHALKPGITGLAQVRGFRGATHKRADLTQRLQADLEYISGWTIGRDIQILMKTALVVVHPNAY
ncbi:exopolysaccharide biosynthesis polyprenyl glycosylphosphotransferase [Croceibacterium sp. LX-88]|uniref:Exopolysaccharide biosynthesis polyprenyl glycosylphosphotransferase n=1 Tax=Croceibacterium selenioxidans TaxID=2838833 RepID=A0ABS5W343_9SPHN|nr:exopolysaccharide biosynthesis polyprenyl glycosylphosphotransferase [Croceibacterium selenioxidans]MBT2132804.1 exopolysaccharide biosynthesis polyprenyl glycosylphosphotransferase [Croceibacterium selenioxidans]